MLSGIKYAQIFLGIGIGVVSDSWRAYRVHQRGNGLRLKISLEAEASKFRLRCALLSWDDGSSLVLV